MFHILCGKQINKERRKKLFSGKLVRTQLYVNFVANLSGVAKKAYNSYFNILKDKELTADTINGKKILLKGNLSNYNKFFKVVS